MKEIKFAGEIRDGKLIIYSRELLNADISKQNDQRVLGSVKPIKKIRTLKQNGTLHWYFQMIADETGMEMEAVKELLKFKFLQKPVVGEDGHELIDPSTGECYMHVVHTAYLNTVELNIFIDKIRMWALDFLNIVLPLPDSQGALKFDENGNINSKTNIGPGSN